MSSLVWSEELELNHPRMDATHQEFVAHLAQIEDALAEVHRHDGEAPERAHALEALVAQFDAMIEHTVAHFGQEDRWMLDTGFAPENCHSLQHKQVLDLLREVRRRLVDKHEMEWMERLMPELIQWFLNHAQAADAGLAYHLSQVGYDTETGLTREPVETASIEGCGPEACTH